VDAATPDPSSANWTAPGGGSDFQPWPREAKKPAVATPTADAVTAPSWQGGDSWPQQADASQSPWATTPADGAALSWVATATTPEQQTHDWTASGAAASATTWAQPAAGNTAGWTAPAAVAAGDQAWAAAAVGSEQPTPSWGVAVADQSAQTWSASSGGTAATWAGVGVAGDSAQAWQTAAAAAVAPVVEDATSAWQAQVMPGGQPALSWVTGAEQEAAASSWGEATGVAQAPAPEWQQDGSQAAWAAAGAAAAAAAGATAPLPGSIAPAGSNAAGFMAGLDGYKTSLCSLYQSGYCALGSLCTFAHGEAELLPKVQDSGTATAAAAAAAQPSSGVPETPASAVSSGPVQVKPRLQGDWRPVKAKDAAAVPLKIAKPSWNEVDTSKLKAEICWNYAKGYCRHGAWCNWLHSDEEDIQGGGFGGERRRGRRRAGQGGADEDFGAPGGEAQDHTCRFVGRQRGRSRGGGGRAAGWQRQHRGRHGRGGSGTGGQGAG